MKVKFIQPYTVRDELKTHYTEGQVVDFSEASAAHFMDRGVAVEYVAPKKKTRAKKND